GQVTDGDQLRILYGDSRQHPRSSVLFEFDDGSGVADGAVAVRIAADEDATFAALAEVVESAIPSTRSVHNSDRNRVVFVDQSLDQHGLLLLVVRNQSGTLIASAGQGDWTGVRDTSDGFTYVEHESGEVELYDLRVDPMQLENKANDQSYAPSRARLAAR